MLFGNSKKLKRTFVRIDDEELENAKKVVKYYENLLIKTPADVNGRMKFTIGKFKYLLCNAENGKEEDADVIIKAFYNFYGHGLRFQQKEMDMMSHKVIEMGFPAKLFEILEKHAFLVYYPHYSVIEKITVAPSVSPF